MKNIINKIVILGIVLLVGYTVQKEMRKDYPDVKKQLPFFIRWMC